MSDSHPFISVIVPVYNGSKFIARCLDALLSNDRSSFEIIVVNDGSTDDSEQICKSKGVRVIQSERPRSGPAAARNLASKDAAGDVLLFVDADVVVEPDTISKIASQFEKHPELSALFGSYDNAPAEQNFLSQYKNLQHHYVHQNSNPEASTFWAGLGAIRADVFRSVGGFDVEQYAVPSIEDIELGVRLRQAGHRILLDRNIQAKHLKKWTPVQLLRTEVFCRAIPWSKLILTKQGVINDMNLKHRDRISAVLTLLSIALLPFVFWWPALLVLVATGLITIFILNYDIFKFFARLKGVVFAAMTFPWLLAYFTYSSASFAFCYLRIAPGKMLYGKGVNPES
jgi:glycosyltransferase involved in cell wall biosynthesis